MLRRQKHAPSQRTTPFACTLHKQFLGHPGHRSSRPGTRFLPAGYPDENVYVPWVPHTAHKLLTPGHRSGDPPPTRSGDPPPTRAVTGKFCLCLCAFSFPDLVFKFEHDKRNKVEDPQRKQANADQGSKNHEGA